MVLISSDQPYVQFYHYLSDITYKKKHKSDYFLQYYLLDLPTRVYFNIFKIFSYYNFFLPFVYFCLSCSLFIFISCLVFSL